MGLIVDNFAGGGGASTGIETALGRAVDIAINHDEEAIRMHEANHPGTVHIRNNIWQVDPLEVCGRRPVDLAWFSPDCKHFSKAKGGKPREKGIRDLAWVVVLWAQRVRPALILLENVEEFRTWGPLDEAGYPIKERAGETFDKWCGELRKLGYKVQFKELRACDYGAPTIRKRFFMVARCDGEPIVWPEPTHAPADPAERAKWIARQRKAGFKVKRPDELKPWRAAAEIIDWSIPCPSIFDRQKPLADKTLRRVAHGVMRFVVNNPRPFIVPLTHNGGEAEVAAFGTYAQQGGANRSIEDPAQTVTASKKDQNCLAGVHMVHVGNGEREGQAPRAMDAEKPLGTVVAGGQKHAAVAAMMTQFRGSNQGNGGDLGAPSPTATAGGQHQGMVCAHLEQANGSPPGEKPLVGRCAEAPLATIVAKGCTQRVVETTLLREGDLPPELMDRAVRVAAFLIKYYGNEDDGHGLDRPIGTVTVQDRFAVVTVTIDATTYVIVDIGLRMLTPRELFNAQGFPPDYVIDRDAEGRPITKTAQVAKCGNSVCPPLAEALVRPNARWMIVAADRESEAA